MGRLALIFGGLLVAVGGIGYSQTGAKTSLIPAWVGLILMILGVVVMAFPNSRKHAMHAAAAIALLGFFAAAARLTTGFLKTPTPPAEGPTPIAIASLAAMTVLCGTFVVICVGSFMSARRRPPIETAGLK